MNKHKVFISYHHANDQSYKDSLVLLNNQYDLFDDYSVRFGAIDETLSTDAIRKYIRDKYIKEATVLILLCGTDTSKRKYVDWEIHASMFHTENNPRLGILVVNLPTIKSSQVTLSNSELERQIIHPFSHLTQLESRSEYEQTFPHLPSRIIDNISKNKSIAIINWETILQNPNNFKKLVDEAYKKRKTIVYDYSAPLRRRNT